MKYCRTDSPRRRSSTTNLNTLGRRGSGLAPNSTGSTTTININNKVMTSPNSRSSSSQQLPVPPAAAAKARTLYAKQGSASLLLQNAQANSSSSMIPSPTPHHSKLPSRNSVSSQTSSSQAEMVDFIVVAVGWQAAQWYQRICSADRV